MKRDGSHLYTFSCLLQKSDANMRVLLFHSLSVVALVLLCHPPGLRLIAIVATLLPISGLTQALVPPGPPVQITWLEVEDTMIVM